LVPPFAPVKPTKREVPLRAFSIQRLIELREFARDGLSQHERRHYHREEDEKDRKQGGSVLHTDPPPDPGVKRVKHHGKSQCEKDWLQEGPHDDQAEAEGHSGQGKQKN